jgi:hypothetical protein
MTERRYIRFYPGGGVRKMAGERDSELHGSGSVRRASHVEPVNWFLRWVFHLIRRRVDDKSRWAAWTRTWTCKWQARIFGGPLLGPFDERQKAIDTEIEWLTNNWILEGLNESDSIRTVEAGSRDQQER